LPEEPQQPRRSDSLQKLLDRIKSGGLIPPPSQISNQPDPQFEAEKLDLDREHHKAEIQSFRQDVEQRKTYANRTFCLVVVWLAAIAVVVFLQGFKLSGFSLDAGIVEALIGGTTTGVVGLFLIVTRYLFPRR
jgi:hypothetical protein